MSENEAGLIECCLIFGGSEFFNSLSHKRTLALPTEVEHWSLTTLREKLIKIGAKVLRQGRYITVQLAEIAVSRALFTQILDLIANLRAPRRY